MAEADFILQHAERILTVATRCLWSFGAADGLAEVLREQSSDSPRQHPLAILQRDAMMMAVSRVEALLDRSASAVSFQTVYHRLKEPATHVELLAAIEARRGEDILEERPARITEFLEVYRSIDWNLHGRLKHFRNLDIAHLRVESRKKSITMDELRTMVGIIGHLGANLQGLVQTDLPFHPYLADESRAEVKSAMRTR